MKVLFVSQWSNATIITNASLDLSTGIVEAEAADVQDTVEDLISETVETEDGLCSAPVKWNDANQTYITPEDLTQFVECQRHSA